MEPPVPSSLAEDVTLFGFSDPSPTTTTPSFEFSYTLLGVEPLSVDEEGLTYYACSQLYTFGIVKLSTETSTLISPPSTTECTSLVS